MEKYYRKMRRIGFVFWMLLVASLCLSIFLTVMARNTLSGILGIIISTITLITPPLLVAWYIVLSSSKYIEDAQTVKRINTTLLIKIWLLLFFTISISLTIRLLVIDYFGNGAANLFSILFFFATMLIISRYSSR